MMIAMVLAHLVGDYVLQWDQLAVWKSREVKGAVAHGLIVLAVTVLFALPFDVAFVPYAVFIGLTHTLVDALQPWLGRRVPLNGPGLFGLGRLLLDQLVHLSLITMALVWGGYVSWSTLGADLLSALHTDPSLTILLGYIFLAMPAWVLVEFVVYGLVNGSAPDFAQAIHCKYVGTLERWLIITFVMLGQFMLVPLVALPRLLFEGPQVRGTPRTTLYVSELLASVGLAVATGLALRWL